LRLEQRTDTLPMRFGGEIRIIKDPAQRALDTSLAEGAQPKDGVALATATGIVGDIGKEQSRQRGVAADRERLLDSFVE
jgi:hypothetical protein